MLAVYCAICQRRTLVGIDEITLVDNLASGVISVTAQCARGHSVLILTGCAVASPSRSASG
jgi:hypothetical protein